MNHKLNNEFSLKNGGYSSFEDSTSLPRHRWYYYKEGFSPNLVEAALTRSNVSKNDLIVDPFNGSGTTTLTCSMKGFQSIGIEVNPFTSFLSDVKLSSANFHDLLKWKGKLLKASEKGSPSDLLGYSTFSKRKELEKWLFNDSVLNSFEGGWRLAESIPSHNIRKIIKLALISSAMQNCNAKRDGKCLRYKENWWQRKLNKNSFIDSLLENMSQIEEDIQAKPFVKKAKILTGDCREILSKNGTGNLFKLCVTSPPYLNTFDYTDIYRPELFLGKFIKGGKELQNLRLKTIRSHIQVKWKKPTLNDFGLLYQQTVNFLNDNQDRLMHKNITLMVQAYFEDMYNILKLLKGKASQNAYLWLVVSNSAYAGLELPVDLIIGDIGAKAGWYLMEIGVLRHIKKRKTRYSTNVKELRESVIIFSNKKFTRYY